MAGKFEIFVDKGGKFRFRLKASNGQIILASQAYKTKRSALNGITSVQNNAAEDEQFQRKENDGRFSFNLLAKNKQVIGTSERYESLRARENGIKSVAKNAPEAKIDDQSSSSPAS